MLMDEGVCSIDLQSRPIRLSVVPDNRLLLPNIDVFGYPLSANLQCRHRKCVSIRRSSLICVAHLQVYERVADNRWWPNIGGLLYVNHLLPYAINNG